jgi:hypothetical protein
MSGLVRALCAPICARRRLRHRSIAVTAVVLDRKRLSPDSDHRPVFPLRRNIARWFCKLGIEDSIPDHGVLPRKARTIS